MVNHPTTMPAPRSPIPVFLYVALMVAGFLLINSSLGPTLAFEIAGLELWMFGGGLLVEWYLVRRYHCPTGT